MGCSGFSLFPRIHQFSQFLVILPLRSFQIYITYSISVIILTMVFLMEIAVMPQLKNDGNFSVLQNCSSQWK